jgi:hypothetical protein
MRHQQRGMIRLEILHRPTNDQWNLGAIELLSDD